MSIQTAIVTNTCATLFMIFTYIYFYVHYRQAFIAKWIIAWIIYEIRLFFFEDIVIAESPGIYISIAYLLLSLAYALLIVAGAADFSGKRFSIKWVISGLLCMIITYMGFLLNLPFAIFSLAAAGFLGVVYIYTGLIFWRTNVRGIGKNMVSCAFVLLGLHLWDMPFLCPIALFAPLGILIDGLLKFFVAVGIILVYFEKAKNELEKYYKLLERKSIDVIFRYRLTEPKGFEYISPAVKDLAGYDQEYFKTIKQVLGVIYLGDRKNFHKSLRGYSSDSAFPPVRLLRNNGDMLWIEQKYTLVQDFDDRVIAVEGVVRDVTRRVLLEQDISRLDRLNMVGQMAASLAHEVRNPLSTVRGYIQLLGTKIEFDKYKERLSMMLAEIDRTNAIITEYLDFSKVKVMEMRQGSLNNIIKAIYPLLEVDAASNNVKINLDLTDIPDLFLDENEIKQMLLNIVRNGIEAMPDGGKLDIRTTTAFSEIILSVRDQGKGIPQHILQNIGKPFLTTKEKGTGLGMAVCYRIASHHNAKLEFNTGPAGTTVFIKFAS